MIKLTKKELKTFKEELSLPDRRTGEEFETVLELDEIKAMHILEIVNEMTSSEATNEELGKKLINRKKEVFSITFEGNSKAYHLATKQLTLEETNEILTIILNEASNLIKK